jgi:hypothetical protein
MRKMSIPARTPRVSTLSSRHLSHVAGGVQVDRAGFLNSDPSDANRLLERHELPGNQGGF